MKITILGSGTSSGVPVVGCDCKVCTSKNPKNNRLRSSCLVETDGKTILIDTTPDLRSQALRFGIRRVDAVLYTHTHADHVHGIDELRIYNILQNHPIPVYGHQSAIDHLTNAFAYIFRPATSYPSFIPRLTAHAVEEKFDCIGIPVQMIPCRHGPHTTYNYRIGDFAWLTDTNGIPDSSLESLRDLKVLCLDGLRIKPHATHFSLDQALEAARRIAAEKTYLIHLTHDYDHDLFNPTLPSGVELSYDGLTIRL